MEGAKPFIQWNGYFSKIIPIVAVVQIVKVGAGLFDHSKARLTVTPSKPKPKHGLANYRGDAEEGLNAEAAYASLSLNN